MKVIRAIITVAVATSLSGCAVGEKLLNPYYEEPGPEAYLGSPNDHALNNAQDNLDSARAALEHAGEYQRAHDPRPENPVMKASVVRLMWIPDHLNKSGDLVPSHYYYVKVKKEDWNVQDAFELEGQLGGGQGDTSLLPFQYETESN